MKRAFNKAIKTGKVTQFMLMGMPLVLSFAWAPVNILFGFALFSYLLKKILNKDFHLPQTPISFAFLLFFSASLISMVNSVDLITSARGLFKLFKYLFIFLMVADELKTKNLIKKIVISMSIGLTIASLNGIYQLIFWKDFFRHNVTIVDIGVPRLTSAFPDANVFGLYLVSLIPIIFIFYLYNFKDNRKRLLLEILLIISSFCLYFTFSRGSALGMLSALLFISLMKKNKLLLLAIVAILIISPLLLPGIIKDWSKQTDSILEFLCNADRINMYRTSLNMIKDHPIIGVGVNTFSKNYKKYRIKETNVTTYGHWRTPDSLYAHNNFLHMAGEIGLLGLAGFIYLLIRLFKAWYNFFKNNKSDFSRVLSLGFVATIIAFLVNGLTETSLYYPRVAWLFWYNVGVVLGICNLKDNTT